MKLQISGQLYCIGFSSAALMTLLAILIPQIYRELGLQLPGLTDLLYYRYIPILLIFTVVSLTIASIWTSLLDTDINKIISCALINLVVFISSVFSAVTILPFTYVIENLGGANGPIYLYSALWIYLPFLVMMPFHIMTLWGLRKRV